MKGKIFGKLLVEGSYEPLVYRDKKRNRKIKRWFCSCDCGKWKIIREDHLKSGSSKYCGCVTNERRKERIQKIKPKQKYFGIDQKVRKLFNGYKSRSKRDKLIFSLSYEEFKKLVLSPCHYSADAPDPTNGIDRLDNFSGYEYSNVVSCCKICNYAKNTMSYEEFMSWIEKVYKIKHLRENAK